MSKHRREMAALLGAVFAVMIGYGVTLTVLPYYTSRVHRLSGVSDGTLAVHIGMLTGAYALAQLLAGPFVGRLTDRLGRRPVALAGLVGVGLTEIAFGMVTSLWWLYFLRVLGGVAASLLTVAATTMVSDWSDERSRPHGMALFGTAVSLGVVAGPLLGGSLSSASVDVLGLHLDGYVLPFVVAGSVALAAAVVLRSVVGESLPSVVAPDRLVRRSSLGTRLALVVAAQFGLALFESTFVLFARDRFAFTVTQTTEAFLVCGFVMAALQLVAGGPLQRVFAPLTQIATGFVLMAAGIVGLLAVSTVLPVLVAVGVLATGTALITPNLAVVVAQTNPSAVGSSLGMRSSASSFGQFLGPVVGGPLLSWRASSPYALAALVLAGAGLSAAVAARVSPPPAPIERRGIAIRAR